MCLLKKNISIRVSLIIFAILLVLPVQNMCAQHKISLTMGVGMLETLNAGFRYQIKDQKQIGLTIGTWPSSSNNWFFNWKSLISVTGDYYLHLFGKSTYSDLNPWYVRAGANYLRIKSTSSRENDLSFQLRFGRNLYFARNCGVSIDGGVLLPLLNQTGFNKLLPSAGLEFFFGL